MEQYSRPPSSCRPATANDGRIIDNIYNYDWGPDAPNPLIERADQEQIISSGAQAPVLGNTWHHRHYNQQESSHALRSYSTASSKDQPHNNSETGGGVQRHSFQDGNSYGMEIHVSRVRSCSPISCGNSSASGRDSSQQQSFIHETKDGRRRTSFQDHDRLRSQTNTPLERRRVPYRSDHSPVRSQMTPERQKMNTEREATVLGEIFDNEPLIRYSNEGRNGPFSSHSRSEDLSPSNNNSETGGGRRRTSFQDHDRLRRQTNTKLDRRRVSHRSDLSPVRSQRTPERLNMKTEREAAPRGNSIREPEGSVSQTNTPRGRSNDSYRSDISSVRGRDPSHTQINFNKKEDNTEFEVDQDERRIVLLGKTGVGKSATANTILQYNFFESKASSNSITKQCSMGKANLSGKQILVVDTPGLFDTKMTHDMVICEIAKCIAITSPGPHAFIIVVQIGRFTEEDSTTVVKFVECFGERLYDYAIVLFTKTDDLEPSQTLSDYVQDVNVPLQNILRKCKNRYVGFNNKAQLKDQDVKMMFDMIDQILSNNKGLCFTNDLYKATEREVQNQMRKLKEQHDKEKEKQLKEKEYQINRKYQEKIDQEQEMFALQKFTNDGDSGDKIRNVETRLFEIEKTLNLKQQAEVGRCKQEIQANYERKTCASNLRQNVRKGSEEKGFLGHAFDGVRSFAKAILSPLKAIFS